jgi:predicted glycogen debranching enzyme
MAATKEGPPPAEFSPVVRRLGWAEAPAAREQQLLDREWLVTNGMGGYASSTVGNVPTRSYHGLLVAALPAPHGRLLMLGPLLEHYTLADGTAVTLGGVEHPEHRPVLEDARRLSEFFLENGLPVWRYDLGGALVERRVWMPHGLNAVMVCYRLLRGPGPARLVLRPGMHFRPYDAAVDAPLPEPFHTTGDGGRVELRASGDFPPLRMAVLGGAASFAAEGRVMPEVFRRMEQARGYAACGSLYTPGAFTVDLTSEGPVTFLASCESWETTDGLPPDLAAQAERERRERLLSLAAPELRAGVGAELVMAADQFIIYPAARREEARRVRAAGDEARTIIAGYHWFTDWGRDTMISLEGLTLVTGRAPEAGYILRTFAHHIRDGLIPNFFPDGKTDGVYHTADATLWLFHALDRYLHYTGDHETLHLLLPALVGVVEHHIRGTRFGIGVDPADGLLRQGEAGYQLTWMDAKVGDWVVTPRRGKAVEINALWYNALCLLRGWLGAENSPRAGEFTPHIERARQSFNARFWNPAKGCLYDVVDAEGGDDDAVRPNQVLAVSLPNAVLDRERWQPVLDVVREKLLTPVGLRSLSGDHPGYQPKYDGNLRMRDAAYHQGTVWPWLIGPYVDAWLRLHPDDRAGARALLGGLVPELDQAGVGSISEIFDAEEPYTPRGCIAQAWSVAEMLRCWLKTE